MLHHSIPFYTQFGLIRNNISSGMTTFCMYRCCLQWIGGLYRIKNFTIFFCSRLIRTLRKYMNLGYFYMYLCVIFLCLPENRGEYAFVHSRQSSLFSLPNTGRATVYNASYRHYTISFW